MRFGGHAFLWTSEATTESLIHALRLTAEAGLEFIEIPLLYPQSLDVAILSSSLREHGLACTCSLVLPADASFPEDPQGAEAFLLQAVEAATRLGSPVLTGVLYSALGVTAPPTSAVLADVATVLKRVAQAAETRGIQLGIEPVNRYETSLLNTAEQALELIAAIDEPNVFLHLDTYHMNIEERGFRRPIVEVGKRLRYLHLSESHRGEPGTGNVRWEEVFAALAAVGFDGYLAIEAFLSPSPNLARATCIWRPPSARVSPQVVQGWREFFHRLARTHGLLPKLMEGP